MRKQLLMAGIATAVLLLGTSAAAYAARLAAAAGASYGFGCINSELGFSDSDRVLGARVGLRSQPGIF